jgi:hypothetical protein
LAVAPTIELQMKRIANDAIQRPFIRSKVNKINKYVQSKEKATEISQGRLDWRTTSDESSREATSPVCYTTVVDVHHCHVMQKLKEEREEQSIASAAEW